MFRKFFLSIYGHLRFIHKIFTKHLRFIYGHSRYAVGEEKNPFRYSVGEEKNHSCC